MKQNLSRIRSVLVLQALLFASAWSFAGSLLAEEMQYPLSVAVNDQGDIFLADRNLPGIWKISQGQLSLYFKGSKKFRTPLNAIRCLEIDKQGRLLAGDSSTREVYRFDEQGQPVPLIKDGVGIGIPMDIAVNSAGELFVADLELHIIWKVPSEGGKPVEFAKIPAPRGLAFNKEDQLWIVSGGKDQVYRISPDGKTEKIVEGRQFSFPHTIVVDDNQTAFVCDGYGKTIWKVSPGEKPTKFFSGKPLKNPVGLARSGADLLVVDPHLKNVFKLDAQGEISPLEFKQAQP